MILLYIWLLLSLLVIVWYIGLIAFFNWHCGHKKRKAQRERGKKTKRTKGKENLMRRVLTILIVAALVALVLAILVNDSAGYTVQMGWFDGEYLPVSQFRSFAKVATPVAVSREPRPEYGTDEWTAWRHRTMPTKGGTIDWLKWRLQSKPVECLRVYRVKVLSQKGERSPWGDIWTRHTAVLETAYGSSSEKKEVQFLTEGGMVGNEAHVVIVSPEVHTNCRYVLALTDQTDPACSHLLGRSEKPDPAFGLLLLDHTLVGVPHGDSIRFDGMGVCIDSVSLCRIVRSITSE